MSRVRVITASPESCEWLLQALHAKNHNVEVAHSGNISENEVDFEIEAGVYSRAEAMDIATAFLEQGGNLFASASAFGFEVVSAQPHSMHDPVEVEAPIAVSFEQAAFEGADLVAATDSFAVSSAYVYSQPDAAEEILNTIAAGDNHPLASRNDFSAMESDVIPQLAEYTAGPEATPLTSPRDSYLSNAELREITADVDRFAPEPTVQDELQSILANDSTPAEETEPQIYESVITEVSAPVAKAVPFVVARAKTGATSENPRFSEVCSNALKEAFGVSREGGKILASKATLAAMETSAWLASLKRTLADRRVEIEQSAVTLRKEEPKRFTDVQLRRWRTTFALCAGLILAAALSFAYINRRPDAISSAFGSEPQRSSPAPIVDARPTAKPIVTAPVVAKPSALQPGAKRSTRRNAASNDFGPEVVVHRYPSKPSPIPIAPHSGIKRFSDIASN